MTERKPAELSVQGWVDRQIERAAARGDFDDLPGKGKPIPGLGEPHDEHWWIKDKLRREGISYLPPALALRKEAADARGAALAARSDAEAREILEAVNERIRDAIRYPPPGPGLDIGPMNVERELEKRRGPR